MTVRKVKSDKKKGHIERTYLDVSDPHFTQNLEAWAKRTSRGRRKDPWAKNKTKNVNVTARDLTPKKSGRTKWWPFG